MYKTPLRVFSEAILTVIVIYLFIDFVSLILWVYSGQHPVDGFYLGSVTANIIKLFI